MPKILKPLEKKEKEEKKIKETKQKKRKEKKPTASLILRADRSSVPSDANTRARNECVAPSASLRWEWTDGQSAHIHKESAHTVYTITSQHTTHRVGTYSIHKSKA
jgi:hypothetical protein